jgi:hypothetical protein
MRVVRMMAPDGTRIVKVEGEGLVAGSVPSTTGGRPLPRAAEPRARRNLVSTRTSSSGRDQDKPRRASYSGRTADEPQTSQKSERPSLERNVSGCPPSTVSGSTRIAFRQQAAPTTLGYSPNAGPKCRRFYGTDKRCTGDLWPGQALFFGWLVRDLDVLGDHAIQLPPDACVTA